jgi:hypothetical protein
MAAVEQQLVPDRQAVITVNEQRGSSDSRFVAAALRLRKNATYRNLGTFNFQSPFRIIGKRYLLEL